MGNKSMFNSGKLPNDISPVSLKLSEKKIFNWIFDLRNDKYRMYSKKPLAQFFLYSGIYISKLRPQSSKWKILL